MLYSVNIWNKLPRKASIGDVLDANVWGKVGFAEEEEE